MSTQKLRPIESLPSEILLQIFELVISSADLNLLRDPSPEAIGLSHICLRWRLIVIGSPTLWNHIFVKFGPHRIKQGVEITTLSESASNRLELCLDRSQSGPLHVQMYFRWIDETPSPDGAMEAFLARLLSTSPLWASLRVSFQSRCRDHIAMFSQCRNTFSILSTLWIEEWHGTQDFFPTDLFYNSPDLSTIQYMASLPDYLTMIPWNQLRSFTSDHEPLALYVAKHSPRLLSLQFSSKGYPYYMDKSSPDVIYNESVRDLEILSTVSQHWINAVQFPNLTVLKQIYNPIPETTFYFSRYLSDVLIPLVEGSCSLGTLHLTLLDSYRYTVHSFRSFFSTHLPNLHTLHVTLLFMGRTEEDFPVTQCLLESLHSSSTSVVLPALQSLTIHTRLNFSDLRKYHYQDIFLHIYYMVLPRSNNNLSERFGTRRLSKFHLKYDRIFESRIASQIHEFQALDSDDLSVVVESSKIRF